MKKPVGKRSEITTNSVHTKYISAYFLFAKKVKMFLWYIQKSENILISAERELTSLLWCVCNDIF